MGPKVTTVERELARMASAAHGVVTRAELVDAGISAAEIKWRVRSGSLLTVHRGVYRVGHIASSLDACYLAATRACGPGALISGRAAAHLFEIVRGSMPPPEVTAPTQRRVPGVHTHQSRCLLPTDATSWRGVAVVTVPWVLVDLAAWLGEEELARACHEAAVRFRIRPRAVDAVLARRGQPEGAAKLRAVLHGEVRVTLSKLESGFLRVLADARLPLPVTNRLAGTRRVDCRWPEHRVTVELDGYRYHHTRHAWEQDRRRAREARARGDEFRRYTYGDVLEEPRLMLAELRALLKTQVPRR